MAIISRVERALNNKKKTVKTNQRNFRHYQAVYTISR